MVVVTEAVAARPTCAPQPGPKPPRPGLAWWSRVEAAAPATSEGRPRVAPRAWPEDRPQAARGVNRAPRPAPAPPVARTRLRGQAPTAGPEMGEPPDLSVAVAEGCSVA